MNIWRESFRSRVTETKARPFPVILPKLEPHEFRVVRVDTSPFSDEELYVFSQDRNITLTLLFRDAGIQWWSVNSYGVLKPAKPPASVSATLRHENGQADA